MKYKNRLTFAYYSIKFLDFKSLQKCSKNLASVKSKKNKFDVQISKYRFLGFEIPIFRKFFPVSNDTLYALRVKHSPKESHLRCYNGHEKLESISVKCHIMTCGSFQLLVKKFIKR